MTKRVNLLFYFYLILLISFQACAQDKKKKESTSKAEKELFKSEYYTDSLFSIGIEGPYFFEGNLYAVNFRKKGNIAVVRPGGKVELFVELPDGSVGNGIRFNKNGEMLVADYTKHNILLINMETQEVMVFAHDDNMNQPNDIAINDKGILFAADPDWKHSTGKLWKIDQSGKTFLLEKNMGTTNGIELSPDNRRLYVNESVQRNVWVYDVDSAGNISDKKLFYKFTDFGMDGMRMDVNGNLYITRYGKGVIAVLSPEGKLIREIKLRGKKPTNLAFGGIDGKTVFITMQDNRRIEVFENDVEGKEWSR
ncbi:MAG: SMP-30/gluconolactonase/LRE family protein [Sporocytophaga sp.]|uniref:SMP-30/gluconolactonase/LRE family protein n=1 Tax=Sporocytophaga sp. TaxID=2231183 RepID=UPI001B17D460|nr:SMP-30/gluconolactonase/LRE family protein [Sporocytophaga sp.]MBO9703634.1 SMP-30/gluconolactonase/LRE family protein [Sporocytophaga sp.]